MKNIDSLLEGTEVVISPGTCITFSLQWYCCKSGIMDHLHHLSDVVNTYFYLLLVNAAVLFSQN
jgi:hypothetical protein